MIVGFLAFAAAAIWVAVDPVPISKIALIAMFVGCIIGTVALIVLNPRYRREVSRALGVPISLFSRPPPPTDPKAYLDWCKRFGLTPYPFDGTD